MKTKKKTVKPGNKSFLVKAPVEISKALEDILFENMGSRGYFTPVMFYRSKKTKKLCTWWAGKRVRSVQ